jgi:hypothetical protein
MPSRSERARAHARARLETEVPASVEEGSLLKAEEEVAGIIRETKSRDRSSPGKLVANAIEEVGRNYYHYVLERSRRRPKPPESRT